MTEPSTTPDDDRPPERRRPVGGAAAWYRVEVPPAREAHDERRERDRYARATLAEQVRGEVRDLSRSRAAIGILLAVVGGFVVLRLLTPEPVTLADLRTGDCLYIRAGDPDTAPPIGTPSAVRAQLLERGAERAPCDGSHSQEVAATVDLAQDGGYPGRAALDAAAGPACTAAFERLPPPPEALRLVVVVPDEANWANGSRAGVCLVQREDGGFMAQDVVPDP